MCNYNKVISRFSAVMLLAMSLMACTTTQYDCNKQGATLILVGENQGADTVSVNGQVFNRVAASLAANLTGKGYGVQTGQQLMQDYPEYFDRDTIVHKDSTLVDLVRSLKGIETDVIVILSIAAETSQQQYHSNVSSGLDVRLIDVNSGKSLGAFAIDSEQSTSIRPSCNDNCLKQAIVDNAKPITLEVAAVIAEKLVCGGSSSHDFDDSKGGFSTAYTVIFDGFTVDEVLVMEDYIAEFSGYESHRVIYTGGRRSEWWYETSMRSASLNRNFTQLLNKVGVRGVVQFSGNTYTIKKITLRGGKAAPRKDKASSKSEDW